MTDHFRSVRSARASDFSCASCTLFSPRKRQPASYARRRRSAGTVLLTGSSRTSCGSRPARRAAASMRSCTVRRLERSSSSVVAVGVADGSRGELASVTAFKDSPCPLDRLSAQLLGCAASAAVTHDQAHVQPAVARGQDLLYVDELLRHLGLLRGHEQGNAP